MSRASNNFLIDACIAEAGKTSDVVELKFALPGKERQYSVLNGLKVFMNNHQCLVFESFKI